MAAAAQAELEIMREISLAIKAGSTDVFRSLYRAEYLNLLRFVMSYAHNSQDAEDIVQDTMISVWENHQSIDPSRNFRSYLYTTARNKALNYLRDNAKRFKDSSIHESLTLLNSLALSSSSVEEEYNAIELQSFIERIYSSLPERVMTIFKMSRQEGLTYNEIAQKMGVTPKVVEYNVSIALKAFRSRIK